LYRGFKSPHAISPIFYPASGTRRQSRGFLETWAIFFRRRKPTMLPNIITLLVFL
jgi:hypothetical protein